MVKDHLPQFKNLSPTSVVIVIHPDEMAIRESIIISDHSAYKDRLRTCLMAAARQQAAVLIVALEKDSQTFPDFLNDISQNFSFVDNKSSDTTGDQALRIADWLARRDHIDHVVFTGGWKDACLIHAMNRVLKRDTRIKDVFGLGVFSAGLNHPVVQRKLTAEVYESLVF